MIEFHTPSLPPPLNLDLAELSGGGSCPSQFRGKTQDGLDVFAHYRGGCLKVHIKYEKGGDIYDNAACILSVGIGPVRDGTMSLTDFCTNFGITINGTIPEESDRNAHLNSDLTGKTTYWSAAPSRVTDKTSRQIVSTACSVFQDALLVAPVLNDKFKLEGVEIIDPDQIETSFLWLIDGASSKSDISFFPEDYILEKPNQRTILFTLPPWKYSSPCYTYPKVKHFTEERNKSFMVAGERRPASDTPLMHQHLNIRAGFQTTDQKFRRSLETLSARIEALFPDTRLEHVNLKTGEIECHVVEPLDPVITAWCNAGHDRWLTVKGRRQDDDWIGVRPARP